MHVLHMRTHTQAKRSHTLKSKTQSTSLELPSDTTRRNYKAAALSSLFGLSEVTETFQITRITTTTKKKYLKIYHLYHINPETSVYKNFKNLNSLALF